MSWLVLVLLNVLFMSLYMLLQRVLLKEEQSDPIAHAFVFQFVTACVFFLYAVIFSEFALPDLRPFVFNLGLMTVLYVAMNIVMFKAFKVIEASQVNIFFTTNSIWVMIWSALFLNELITPLRILGTVLVVIGVGIVLWRGKLDIRSPGVLYALLAALLFGAAFTNDLYLLPSFDPSSYLTIAFLFPALGALLVRPSTIKHLSFYADTQRLLKLIFVAIFYAAAIISIFLAYTYGGEASQISPISQSSVILTVILSYFFLKERDYIVYKLIGSIVIFIGILLIV